MAGLIKKNFKTQVLTELSWIMTAINDLSSKLGVETYETVLIKYRVQPEEESAIDQFFALHVQELDAYTVEATRENIAEIFFERTQKQWSLSDEVMEKLIRLRRKELNV